MNPILVAGTGSWVDPDEGPDWFCPGHPFGQFLADQGVAPTYDGDRPFIWSTNLAGIPFFTKNRDWVAGGAALAYFIKYTLGVNGANTSIIAHSHGLQVVLYACANHQLKIQVLISVNSPVRKDMREIAWLVRPQIGYWLHIHSDGGFCGLFGDRWQWLGEIGDGYFGIVRKHPCADRNTLVKDVGHSKLLRDPAQYHHWTDNQWLDSLKG